jgi:hypothetical protein
MASNGDTVLTTLEYSVSKGIQKAYKNGSVVFSQAPQENRYIGGAFFFPGSSYWGSNYIPRFTLGEMLVMRGTMSDQERSIYEGYLSHKWGISGNLPSIHEFKSGTPKNFDGESWKPGTSFAKLYWTDKSNQRNHASSNGSPTWGSNTQNGLALMTYSGADGEYHDWEKINDIRTVFWVVRKNGTDSNRFLLGSGEDYNFHTSGNNYLHSEYASTAYAGILRENGSLISIPQDIPLPQNLSVISLRSYSDLKASNFTNDRNIGGRTWKGDLGELLIFNEALEDDEIESIEGYLAHKWGLEGSLISGHPYESGPPAKNFGQPFTFGSGQELEKIHFELLHYLPAYRENDLISRWDFEDSTVDPNGKTRIIDMGPARNDGFIEGNAHLTAGRFGNALNLNGSGDFLTIPKFRGAYTARNLTFSAWVKLSNSGSSEDSDDASIFSTDGSSTNHARLWYDINANGIGNRTYSFILGSTLAQANRASGNDGLGIANQWQFIVWVMDQDQRTLYVDGNLISQSNTPTPSITLEGNNARIGSWNEDSQADFEGQIDEMRIYGVSFAQHDIDAMWNSGSGDLGIVPVIELNHNHAATEVNGTIKFYQVGNQVEVTGLDPADVILDGATLGNISADGNGGYNVSILPKRPGVPFIISIPENSANEVNGTTLTGGTSAKFIQSPTITAQNNLVLWYNFEGNETDRVVDLSNRYVDASLFGGKRVPGKFSQSLQFFPGEYLRVSGDDFSFNQTFTISLWTKILDNEEGIILRNGQVSLEYRDDLKMYGSLYTTNGWEEIGSIAQLGKWAHYSLSNDSQSLKLFINGNLINSRSLENTTAWESLADRNLYFGTDSRLPWDRGGKFILDELRVYDRALSENEIEHLYGHGSGDLGIRPIVSGDSIFSDSLISQSVQFWKEDANISVSGLELAEINASGASLLNFNSPDLSYDLNASSKPSLVRVSLPHGAVSKDGNLSQAGAYEFQHRTITSVEDGLVAWYTFDSVSGSTIADTSGNLRHAILRASDISEDNNSDAISSSETSSTSYGVSNAFDNNIVGSNDKWLTKWDGNPVYIQYDFETSTQVGSYAIYSQNADKDIKSPRSWIFEGSNDSNTWEELHAVKNQTNWSDWEKRTYTLPESANYRYYRISFTETTGNLVPTHFQDLQLWLDASDSASIEGTANVVSRWNDKSGLNNHLLSSGDPSTNTRSENSQNVIDFDGNDYFESASSYPTGNDFSFFLVAGIDAITNAYQAMFSIRQAAGDPSFQIDAASDSSFLVRFWNNGVGTNKNFSSTPVHGTSIYEFIFDDSKNELAVYVDGNSLGTTSYSTAPNQQNTLTLFTNRGRGLFVDGFVAEMIGIQKAVSSTERKRIEGYLAHKWGLNDSLSSTHPLTYLSIGEIEFFPPAQVQPAEFNNAMDFSADFLELPFRIDQSVGSDGLSVALWLRPDAVNGAGNNPSIFLSTNNGGNDWSLGFKDGFPFIRTGKLELTTPQYVYANQWIHLVGVFDPQTARVTITLNGIQATLNALGFDPSTARMFIGADSDGSNPYDGLMDDLRIWNRVLSTEEIGLLYGNGLGDLGPKATILASSPDFQAQVDAVLSFNQPVNDFNATTDLDLTGVTLLESSTDDNQTFLLSLLPNSFSPSTLSIELKAGSVSDRFGSTNNSISKTIDFRAHRIREFDLLLWWKLDGDLSDSSGGGNTGSSVSPDWNSSGKFGSAFSLDSTDGRSVTHSGLATDLPEATLSVWVYPRSENFHIFQTDPISSALSWTIQKRRPLFFYNGLSQSYLPGGPIDEVHGRDYLSLNTWTHLALTYEFEIHRLRLFTNGNLDIESSFSANLTFPSSDAFRLGPTDEIDTTSGEVDDFRIYDRALSIGEIQKIFGGGKGDFDNHTIELTTSESFALPIVVTARFLRDGYPVDLNGSFSNSDASISTGNASLSSVTKSSTGEYLIEITPDNNTTFATITLDLDGSTVSTKHFGKTFPDSNDSSIDLIYDPQPPVFSSPNLSRWTRGIYSEFSVSASNYLFLSGTGFPDWLELNATTGILSGTPNEGNSTQITLTASNPAHSTSQSHTVEVFDPSVFGSRMEFSPQGVFSAQTPHNLPGLILQLDASEISEANGSIIHSWKDSSGNGRDLNQYRGKPMVLFNEELENQKVVRFDGYSQLYSSLDVGSLIEDYSISALIRHTGGLNQAVIASVGTDWVFGLGDSRSAYWKMDASLVNPSPPADQGWHIMTGTVERDGEVMLWRDGFLMHQGTPPNLIDYKPKIITLGGAQANEDFSNSEVAEVLFYDRKVKDSERRELEDYLKLKWMPGHLDNFPLLVRLSSGLHPDFNLNTFADPQQGGDLRIYDQKGQVLRYEIDEWNSTTGESTVWISVNEMNADLRIFAYWGNENNQTLPPYRSDGSVWTNYEGVWHFSDYTDSSANNRTASTNGSPESYIDGISGPAIELDGISDTLTISSYAGRTGDSPRTIESWIKSEQSASGIMGWGTVENRWNFGWNSQGPNIILADSDNGSGKRQGSKTVGNGSWKHLLVSYPGNGADLNATRLYLNGQLVDAPSSSLDATVNTGTGTDLVIGALADSNSHLLGLLDETRLSAVSRSHGWARLSYESQRTDENFLWQDLIHQEAPILPNDLNLTVVNGIEMAFQLSSNPPATLYELNGTLPGGLSFNQATGLLSGTPNVTGNFELNATASNGKGSSTIIFTIDSKASVEAPTLSSGQVNSTQGTSALLTGELLSSGGTSCNIILYYGTVDQNETEGAWEHSLSLGSFGQGPLPATLTSLDSGKSYFYKFKASNPAESWSDTGLFSTLPYDQGVLRIHTGIDSQRNWSRLVLGQKRWNRRAKNS